MPDVEWFSPEGTHVDWYTADASLTCFFGAPTAAKLIEEEDIAAGGIEGTPRHVLIFAHAGSLPRLFHVPTTPAIAALPWRLFVSTHRSAPADIHADGRGPLIDVTRPFELSERSLVCLVADVAPQVPPLGLPAPTPLS